MPEFDPSSVEALPRTSAILFLWRRIRSLRSCVLQQRPQLEGSLVYVRSCLPECTKAGRAIEVRSDPVWAFCAFPLYLKRKDVLWLTPGCHHSHRDGATTVGGTVWHGGGARKVIPLSLSGSAFVRPGSGRPLPLLPPVFLGKRQQTAWL